MTSKSDFPAQSHAGAGIRTTDSADDVYFEHTRPELRSLVPDGARRVLDVGCGSGALGASLKADRGTIEVWGLEGFPEAAERAATRLDGAWCVNLDALSEVPRNWGTFDAMIFGDVLEHLIDPERLIRALLPALRPDGVLIMSVPNLNHWSVIYPLMVHDRFAYSDAGLLDRSHIRFFTLQEISDLVDRLALSVDYLSTNDLMPIPANGHGFARAIAQMTDDAEEALGRLGAYQYLVRAHRGDGHPTPPATWTKVRITDPGFATLVPDEAHVIHLPATPDSGPVLDATVLDELATVGSSNTPRTFVLDGVLGHLREPERVLAALRDAMSPDDRTVVSVRNLSCGDTLGPLVTEDRWTYGASAPLVDHPTRFFTLPELRELITGVGFRIEAEDEDTASFPDTSERFSAIAAQHGGDAEVVMRAHARRWMRMRLVRDAAGETN